MKKISISSLFCLLCLYGMSQDFSVTFTATGNTNSIDSITATNLSTNQNVTFPGNETLFLTNSYNGIPFVSEVNDNGMVYPNPCSGRTTFSAIIQKPQMVKVTVVNLAGQVLAQTMAFVQQGENRFDLSVSAVGTYSVIIETEKGIESYKLVCNYAVDGADKVEYAGAISGYQNGRSSKGTKSMQTGSTLGYIIGDVIHYRCKYDVYTTLITDSPTASKNYEVEFVACNHLDGRNYSIVKIGTQTWMAENLAYLPEVSPYSDNSVMAKRYYVYGYEGTSVSDAKAIGNYKTYGVLYNWEAAKSACPNGWHLPTDYEWMIIEQHFGMNDFDARDDGFRKSGLVGGKLKETGTMHWMSSGAKGNNISGFTALPGGMGVSGGFGNLGSYARFWTSSEYQAADAWSRGLAYHIASMGRNNFSRSFSLSVRCIKNN